MNVSTGIERMARFEPDKTAIIGDDERITFEQLDAAVNEVARLLRDSYGIRSGDRVAILGGSTIEFLIGFYGAIRAGGIAVPFHDEWTQVELEARIRDCAPAAILDSDSLTAFSFPWLSQGEREKKTAPLPDQPGREQSFYIAYTSGSTGQPKGILRNNGSWLDSYLAATVEFGLTSDDKVLAPGPLFFSLSLFAVTHILFLGGTACIMSRFDPRRVLSIIEREEITALCMVPTLYEALLEVANQSDLRSMKTLICAGAAWPRADEAKREVLKLFSAAGLYEYYGAAELSFVSVSRPADQMSRPRSVGKPFLGVQIELRRNDGTLARPGETGTLYARSPFGFQGYYNDPERTASVLHNGWMTVGDLARIDKEGYLYIVGRADNVVIVGGANVNVEEVEAILASHPQVVAAAVLGINDLHRGQVLGALVQLRAGANTTVADLRRHCAGYLARHKVPRYFQSVEQLPLTATGKIDRAELLRLFSEYHPDRRGFRSRVSLISESEPVR